MVTVVLKHTPVATDEDPNPKMVATVYELPENVYPVLIEELSKWEKS